ncbi:conserved hypothetical protein [Coccidioides posadasii str. Silveira]|uniref:Uncharacterized protein n=2 Tax=Coccidioides posadasii TaxID=199306 RepID=E9CY51_COCPS|nr:conserved hypothetical protein [Coccidioides posadasii str. Silveira]KMM72564.1 hypothetical protein CPAG_08859 [Coccidioides posadasii RMSCC 3488]
MLREEGRAIGMAEKDREGQDLKTTQAKDRRFTIMKPMTAMFGLLPAFWQTVPRGRPENPLELAKDATSSRGRAKSPMEQIPQMPKDISRYRTRYLRVVVVGERTEDVDERSHIGGEPRGR